MFLEILELRIENINLTIKKTVLKTWSQICGGITYWSIKILLGKVQEKDKRRKKLKCQQSLSNSRDKTSNPRLWFN